MHLTIILKIIQIPLCTEIMFCSTNNPQILISLYHSFSTLGILSVNSDKKTELDFFFSIW